MIDKLTSELHRINQGCGDIKQNYTCGAKDKLNKLCPTCQKEKETLKEVSIMWADDELKFMREINLCEVVSSNFMVLGDVEEKIHELKEIKSLMEKT
jgi:hypothetical protein